METDERRIRLRDERPATGQSSGGIEIFIVYEFGGWERFVLLAIVVVAAWISVELLPFDEESSGDKAA